MDHPPVFITASGCITPMGNACSTWAQLVQGNRSLQLSPVFGISGDPVPLSLIDSLECRLPPDWIHRLTPLAASIPDRPWGSRGYPLVVTSSNFGIGHILEYNRTQNPEHIRYAQADQSIQRILEQFGWKKNFTVISQACVSSDIGIRYASQLLRQGAAREVMVFSFDFLSSFVTGGFHSLKILNSEFPSPYGDRESGSIGLGDGAAFVVLSLSEERFSISDQYTDNEMYHMTANQPDGSGFRNALSRLRQRIGNRKVWVKGHGTGTREAGKLEAEAVRALFEDAPLVSWKGGIGHTLGSCGLVELTIAIESFRNNQAPGTVGTGIAFTENVKTTAFSLAGYSSAVLSSNAFGGAHAALVLNDRNASGNHDTAFP